MKTRLTTLCVILALSLTLLAGCALTRAVDQLVTDAQAANPTAAIMPIDQTGDGIPDVLMAILPDGTQIEIPNSRPLLAEAQLADQTTADWLMLMGAVIGIPGLTAAGRWWARRQPMTLAVQTQAVVTDLVRSVQAAADNLSAAERANLLRILAETQSAETKAAVLAAKASMVGQPSPAVTTVRTSPA